MTTNPQQLEQAVERAVAIQDGDVRENVRRITLAALSDGKLDTDEIKRVMRAVLHGAQQGAQTLGEPGAHGRDALSEALQGLDEALGAAAEATDLAVREAVARSAEFSRHELRHSLDDLAELETLFIDTLKTTAASTTGFAAATLHDVADHARNSGTFVGRRVQGSLTQLRHTVGDLAHTQVDASVHGLRSGSALLANIAAGFLAGIAERLEPHTSDKTASDTPAPRD